jgi:hypothetical protein
LALLAVLAVAGLVYALLRYGGLGAGSPNLTPVESFFWAALAGAVLLLSLHRFFFPSRYEIDEEGLTYQHLFGRQRYRWDQFHRFLVDERGGFLMMTRHRPRLRPLRGVHVLFDGAREQAVPLIRRYLRKGERA